MNKLRAGENHGGTISPCTPGTDGPAKGREREAFGPVLLILLRQNSHCAQLYLILRYSSCLQLQRCQKVDYLLRGYSDSSSNDMTISQYWHCYLKMTHLMQKGQNVKLCMRKACIKHLLLMMLDPFLFL